MKIKAYSIFDDFTNEAKDFLEQNDVDISCLEKGKDRPSGNELKKLLEEYDVLIIGTGQVLEMSMFENIISRKIIATASIGIDHIKVPDDKKEYITIVNAPIANQVSVAEHIFSLVLALKKGIAEARRVAFKGEHKKKMEHKTRDLYGSKLGVIGAGGTAKATLALANAFGMKSSFWTRNPQKHKDLIEMGYKYENLQQLIKESDVITINMPLNCDTTNLIDEELVKQMKNDCIVISISRSGVVDECALLDKAKEYKDFCVGLDIDADGVKNKWSEEMDNVIVTPHIAGGTIEARQRMFYELSENIVRSVKVC